MGKMVATHHRAGERLLAMVAPVEPAFRVSSAFAYGIVPLYHAPLVLRLPERSGFFGLGAFPERAGMGYQS
jgi:hypothetical protein